MAHNISKNNFFSFDTSYNILGIISIYRHTFIIMAIHNTNNEANTNIQYTIPKGVKVINKVMSSPEVGNMLNQIVPNYIPDLKSLTNPNNPWAINGLVNRLGIPKGHAK